MKIVKRTFDARKHPEGSQERARFNLNWKTSEYMPSSKYGIEFDDGTHYGQLIRTKKEGEEYIAWKMKAK